MGPPVISGEDAARLLCELFLANADRGDNAANDHLVVEMVHRIRVRQASPDHDGSQPPWSHLADPASASDDDHG